MPDGPLLLVDTSASAVAEDKVRFAYHRGKQVPDNCLIDVEDRPTNDPKTLYGSPPGAILPFDGHKGYALRMLAEMLAGALTRGGCSDSAADRLANNMLSIVLAPSFFQADEAFAREMRRYIDYVRTSLPAKPGGEILLPGEPEERTRAKRLREGIELESANWDRIVATCSTLLLPSSTVAVIRSPRLPP